MTPVDTSMTALNTRTTPWTTECYTCTTTAPKASTMTALLTRQMPSLFQCSQAYFTCAPLLLPIPSLGTPGREVRASCPHCQKHAALPSFTHLPVLLTTARISVTNRAKNQAKLAPWPHKLSIFYSEKGTKWLTCSSFSSSVHASSTTPGRAKQAKLSTWPLVSSSPKSPLGSQMIFCMDMTGWHGPVELLTLREALGPSARGLPGLEMAKALQASQDM